MACPTSKRKKWTCETNRWDMIIQTWELFVAMIACFGIGALTTLAIVKAVDDAREKLAKNIQLENQKILRGIK